MIIEEKKIQLKNGQECILRSPKLEDADQLIDYLKVTASETEFVLKYPEEVKISVEKEREILKWFMDSQSDLMIIAEVEGRVAGNCSFSPVGKKIKIKHRCSMGIALYEKYWGLGIGTALLEVLFNKAVECGYEQMELEVASPNKAAIALYKKMGFVEYGIRPQGLKLKDGTYFDEILMVKQL